MYFPSVSREKLLDPSIALLFVVMFTGPLNRIQGHSAPEIPPFPLFPAWPLWLWMMPESCVAEEPFETFLRG